MLKLFSASVLILVAAATYTQDAAARLRFAEQTKTKLVYTARVRTESFPAGAQGRAEVTIYQNGPRSRLVYSLPGNRQKTILDDGKHLYELDPDTKTALKSVSTREPGRIETLLRNYTVSIVDRETIAGRECDVIAIRGKRPQAPSRRVWIDRRTGLVMRMDSFDTAGRLTTRTTISHVDYTTQLSAELFRIPEGWNIREVTRDVSRHYSREEIARLVGFNIPVPSYVPSGFVLDGYHLSTCAQGVPYCIARYVDGLASVSIISRQETCPKCGRSTFVEAQGRGKGQRRRLGQGAGCGAALRMPSGSVAITRDGVTSAVMGELPKAELERIASSLK